MSLLIPRWMGTNPNAHSLAVCDAQTDYDFAQQRCLVAFPSKTSAGIRLVYGQINLPRSQSSCIYGGLMSLTVEATLNDDGSAVIQRILLAGDTLSFDVNPVTN